MEFDNLDKKNWNLINFEKHLKFCRKVTEKPGTFDIINNTFRILRLKKSSRFFHDFCAKFQVFPDFFQNFSNSSFFCLNCQILSFMATLC